MPSGFPDLVSVTWHEPTAAAWRLDRLRLSRDDLRLLHVLAMEGPTERERLEELNFPAALLARLSRLGMVATARNRWRVVALRECFAVRTIVAFEAKVSDWNGALEQAWVNRWFASESYVLLPRLPRSSSLLADAAFRGVGIWVLGHRRPVLRARRDGTRQPLSIASWLFNEWVWHASVATGRESVP